MRTPGTVARMFIDGHTLHIKRLVGNLKQRTNALYPHHCKKGLSYLEWFYLNVKPIGGHVNAKR